MAAPYPSNQRLVELASEISRHRPADITPISFAVLGREGIFTYSPFSPEQIRKPSILKQSPMVTLA